MELTELHLPRGRIQLQQVLAASGDVIHISDVTKALSVSRTKAAKRLARWREQGWLSRVGAGAYVPASLDTLGAERVLDDGWILVPELFAPAYVAGRTAAEHWDLTEQIFKDIVVVTGQAIRQRQQTRQGFDFTLKHLDPGKIFGTQIVWRHRTKVPVSDVHRTIVEMLDEPALGGGIRHVSDCLAAYLKRSDRNDRKLIDDISRRGIRPSGCIVGEPTGMKLVIAHKGKRSFRCRVRGREARTSGVAALPDLRHFTQRRHSG